MRGGFLLTISHSQDVSSTWVQVCVALQEANMQLVNDLGSSRKYLEQLCAENAKKARKKARRSRSIACQCNPMHTMNSAAEGKNPVKVCGSQELRMVVPDHNSGHVQRTVLRHFNPQV